MDRPRILKDKTAWAVAFVLIGIHVILCQDAVKRLSPPWDEMVGAAAGAAQWETGRILAHANSFLSRLIQGTFVLPFHPTIPLDHPSWEQKNWAVFGHLFLFHNRVPAKTLIFWSRMPSILFSAATGLLIFFWLKNLWGPESGLLALFSYCSIPVFLSRATLALMEMPMFFFILLALFFYNQWRENHKITTGITCSAFIGLALLCKFSALPVLLGISVNEILFSRQAFPRRIVNLLSVILGAGAVVIIGYEFCVDGRAALKESIRFPFIMDQTVSYFWNGKMWESKSSLITLGAVAIKAPLFSVGLSILGLYAIWRKKENRSFLRMIILFTFSFLMPVLFFNNPVSTIHVSSFYLGLVILAGGGWLIPAKNLVWRVLALAPFLIGMISTVAAAHPNYLAYFNQLVGGSSNGYKWLGDSDQDWGQSLPALADFLSKKAPGNLFLCYSGASEPAAYGLKYIDLFSPALVSGEPRLEPGFDADANSYLAIGTKVLQIAPDHFEWLFKNRKPIALVDSCFFIFDGSQDAEIFEWMKNFYEASGRTELAAWSNKQALQYRSKKSQSTNFAFK